MESLSECSRRIVEGGKDKWNLDLGISSDDEVEGSELEHEIGSVAYRNQQFKNLPR